GDRGEADDHRGDELEGRRPLALVVLFDRLEPGQPVLLRPLDGEAVVGIDLEALARNIPGLRLAPPRAARHHCISSTASTPMMARPLRTICPIAAANSSRDRVRSGRCATRKRFSGSSLPLFHSAWK